MSAVLASPPALAWAARPVPPRLPVPTPAATRNAVSPIALMLGDAPLARRACITSMSPPMVARSNGVHPVLRSGSMKRPLLPPRLGRCMLSSGPGSTPAASSALIDVHIRIQVRDPKRALQPAPGATIRGSQAAAPNRQPPDVRPPFDRSAMYRAVRPHQSQTGWDLRRDPTTAWRHRCDRYPGRSSAASRLPASAHSRRRRPRSAPRRSHSSRRVPHTAWRSVPRRDDTARGAPR